MSIKRSAVTVCAALTVASLVGPAAVSMAAALPAVSVGAGAVLAGPRASKIAFVVSLSARSSGPVSVNYSTVDGSAAGGTDFVAASGVVTIAAGSLRATVNVAVNPLTFTTSGADKSFTLDLSTPIGAQPGTLAGIGVIHADPYLAAHSGSLQDVVIDPNSRTAYITNSALNEVEVLNLRTGSYGKPISVGSQPAGIDITPDGTTLYVCDSGAQTISVVDLATHKVSRNIITPSGFDTERALSIAIANNGHAVFTTTFFGSGFGAHVYDLNMSNDTITVLNAGGFGGAVTEDTPVTRSSDHSTIAGLLGDDSGGPFFIYHAATGKVTNGSLNASSVQWGALSGNGSELLVDGGTFDVNTATGTLAGTISGFGTGIAVNSPGSTGYRLQLGTVGVLDVTRFLVTSLIPVPDATTGNVMVISPDNHTLVALTASGATIVKV